MNKGSAQQFKETSSEMNAAANGNDCCVPFTRGIQKQRVTFCVNKYATAGGLVDRDIKPLEVCDYK